MALPLITTSVTRIVKEDVHADEKEKHDFLQDVKEFLFCIGDKCGKWYDTLLIIFVQHFCDRWFAMSIVILFLHPLGYAVAAAAAAVGSLDKK